MSTYHRVLDEIEANSCMIVKNIKLLCVLASETGLKKVADEFPDLEVWLYQDIFTKQSLIEFAVRRYGLPPSTILSPQKELLHRDWETR